MENNETVIKMSAAFAERLMDLMCREGLNNAELAEQITAFPPHDVPLSASAVSDYMNPKKTRLPKIELLTKMANFFGVTVDYLIGNTRDRTPDVVAKAVGEYIGIRPDLLASWKSLKLDCSPYGDVLSILMLETVLEIKMNKPNTVAAQFNIGKSLLVKLWRYFEAPSLSDGRYFFVADSSWSAIGESVHSGKNTFEARVSDLAQNGTGGLSFVTKDSLNDIFRMDVFEQLPDTKELWDTAFIDDPDEQNVKEEGL